jgi:hypothetical protein
MKMTIGNHAQGFVVVTDDAILSVISKSQLEAAAPALGGLLGAAIGSTIGKRMEQKKADTRPTNAPPEKLSDLRQVWECKVGDLPKAIRTSPQWPRVEEFRSVTIYPKRAIQNVKVSIWRGLVLMVNAQAAPMAVQMWQLGKMKKHLSAAGYVLA